MITRFASGIFAASLLLPSFAWAIVDGTETFTVPDTSLASEVEAGPGQPFTVTNVQGWDFTLRSEGGATLSSMDIWNGAVGSGNGVAFYEPYGSNDVFFNGVLITPTGDFNFDLDSIGLNLEIFNGIQTVANQEATLYGIDSSGAVIVGAELTQVVDSGILVTFDTSGFAAFDQIAGMLITPTNGSLVFSYGFIDDIAVSNVAAIPEPSTWAAFAGVLVLGVAAIRRRQRSLAS